VAPCSIRLCMAVCICTFNERGRPSVYKHRLYIHVHHAAAVSCFKPSRAKTEVSVSIIFALAICAYVLSVIGPVHL
jgi:hypothetical protein